MPLSLTEWFLNNKYKARNGKYVCFGGWGVGGRASEAWLHGRQGRAAGKDGRLERRRSKRGREEDAKGVEAERPGQLEESCGRIREERSGWRRGFRGWHDGKARSRNVWSCRTLTHAPATHPLTRNCRTSTHAPATHPLMHLPVCLSAICSSTLPWRVHHLSVPRDAADMPPCE
eukprot:351012-Chlamydomonas_euryale.AAC.17